MKKNESGIALIATLLILVLLGVLLQAFILSVNTEQEHIGIDRGQNQSFYGAMAGLEQLTAGLGDLMATNSSLTSEQLADLVAISPALSNIYFAPNSNPLPGLIITPGTTRTATISSGIYAGLIGSITPYTISSTARAIRGQQEAKMIRDLQVIQIPVFQFGIFSENSLSIFPGSTFDFGGRVHTNSNLHLSCSNGTLYLRQKVTAAGEVIRDKWSNGAASSSGGTVSIAAPGGSQGDPRILLVTEGSSSSDWKTKISPVYYNNNLLNGATGAKKMELPITSTPGAGPIDIIRRPVKNETGSLLKERHFTLASMRILLSDSKEEITDLPYASGDEPIKLNDAYAGQKFGRSPGGGDFRTPAGTELINGYLKIEIQTSQNQWQDVTATILASGFTGSNLGGTACANPSPNAIVRLQRLKDNTSGCGNVASSYDAAWPNVLYDTREGALNYDDSDSTKIYLGGVMHYVELDMANLCSWLKANAGTIYHPNEGFLVYFSDRRTNKNSGKETGEYGNESLLDYYPQAKNPYLSSDQRKTAGDVNGNGSLETYGRTPITVASSASPLDSSATPETTVSAGIARKNRAIFFRRALKLVNGKTLDLGINSGNSIPYGLSISSENPVYVQGDYNAPNGTPSSSNNAFATGNRRVAASIMADAVTLLSNNWNDKNSFDYPQASEGVGRNANTTSYGMAIISGTNKSFPNPSSYPSISNNFGTDGGLHNFLRYLENWRIGSTQQYLWYEGSLVSFYYSRQAVGIFKNGGKNPVYYQPIRQYKFNADFQDPAKLPPFTPRFRDINITGFTQLKMANQ